VLTGAGALVLGYPLLTTHTAHVIVPVLGDLHLPSAAIFDLGVFAVVLGSSMLLLTALAHQSLRARRRGPGAGA
jgi:multicomponent K+:H+ antiporter subunit A